MAKKHSFSLAGLILMQWIAYFAFTGGALYASESNPLKDLENAKQALDREMRAAEENYRKGVALSVGKADRIDLFLLNHADLYSEENQRAFRIQESAKEFGSDVPDTFYVRPLKKWVSIIDKVEIASDCESFTAILQAVQVCLGNCDHGFGAIEHAPTHGIRLYFKEQLLFETSVSFDDGEFFVAYGRYDKWHCADLRQLREPWFEIFPLPDDYSKKMRVLTEEYLTD